LDALDTAARHTDEPGVMDASKYVYAGSFVLVAVLVIGVFANRGFGVVGGILAYLFSLSTMTLTVKSVFVSQKFNFPKFVTLLHFLCCAFLCFGIMMYRQISGHKRMPVPSMKQMCTMIAPIAVSFAASVGASNIGLVYCNASFVEMIGATSPLWVICINLVEGHAFDMRLLWPVLVVIVGACMCAGGELKFTWLGFLIIMASTFLRSFKSNLQQKLMGSQNSEDKLEPVELLGWMTPPCLLTMAIWGGLTEGFEPIVQLASGNGLEISMAIGLTCVNACVLNVANNYVIRDLGAVGAMLAGQFKTVLVLMGASVMLGEIIQTQQIVGYVVTVVGAYFYNSIEKGIRDAKVKDLKEDLEDVQEKASLVK